MKAIDTNIVVRFLVRDDEKQATFVHQRLKGAEAKNEVLLIPLLVVLETIWVLESIYDVSRIEILDSLDELLLMPVFHFETPEVIQRLIASARETTLDLSDLLIAHSARRLGCDTLITFDKRAAKSEFFEILSTAS